MDEGEKEQLLIRVDERIKNIYNRMDKFETLFTNHLHHHELWENDIKNQLHRWLALVVAAAGGAGAMGMMQMASVTFNSTFRNKVRLLAGISSEELDNENIDILGNMSVDWFQAESSLTYTLGGDAGYDQVIVYYTCFLASVVENGMGIERIRLADVEVYYDTKEYRYFIDLALEMLRFKLGVSIKTTTYNADPHLGTVNWNKNVTGEDSTKNIRKRPRGVNYGN